MKRGRPICLHKSSISDVNNFQKTIVGNWVNQFLVAGFSEFDDVLVCCLPRTKLGIWFFQITKKIKIWIFSITHWFSQLRLHWLRHGLMNCTQLASHCSKSTVYFFVERKATWCPFCETKGSSPSAISSENFHSLIDPESETETIRFFKTPTPTWKSSTATSFAGLKVLLITNFFYKIEFFMNLTHLFPSACHTFTDLSLEAVTKKLPSSNQSQKLMAPSWLLPGWSMILSSSPVWASYKII